MPLLNMFSNSLDDLINSSDKKNVISRRQNRNVIILQLPAIKRNRIAGHFKLEEQMKGEKDERLDIN